MESEWAQLWGGKPFGKGEGRNQRIISPKSYRGFDDSKPPLPEYFEEMKRVSKNQIIFGGNYFAQELGNSSCWIVWDKDNGESFFADCELAWTSFKTAVRKFKWKWNGMLQEDMKNKQVRIHPTEKPKQLYTWLLKKFAKENDKILDTHLGSGSIALAIDSVNKIERLNLSLTASEIEPTYYTEALKRIEQLTAQTSLFSV